jgi:hypothetical protein
MFDFHAASLLSELDIYGPSENKLFKVTRVGVRGFLHRVDVMGSITHWPIWAFWYDYAGSIWLAIAKSFDL